MNIPTPFQVQSLNDDYGTSSRVRQQMLWDQGICEEAKGISEELFSVPMTPPVRSSRCRKDVAAKVVKAAQEAGWDANSKYDPVFDWQKQNPNLDCPHSYTYRVTIEGPAK